MTTAAASTPALAVRRDLGVAWMNHGHALISADRLPEAVAAYDRAIGLLRSLPVAENPAWTNSLGAAWMNHGQLLHRLHGTGQADAALASFDAATVLLRPLVHGDSPWPRRNLAGTQLNRANLLLDLARHGEAMIVAREAIALASPHERTETVDADLALKARRAACDALGRLIIAAEADQDALAAEASDLADDAFALIRHWRANGETSFQPLALRFFRFGTQLYRQHQPHFLAEFIRENLPLADAEFHSVARAAIDATLAEHAFLVSGDPATERRLAIWRELAALRPHLAA